MKRVPFALGLLLPILGFADNPIVQTLYTADPAPMVWKDTLFLYTGHDEDVLVSNFYTMNDWRTYSTTDMVNWRDRGSPLSYKTFSWSGGKAWAAQCIPRNGKFYWYVCAGIGTGGQPAIGVAVSDNPTGPFKDPLGKPLASKSWVTGSRRGCQWSGSGARSPSPFRASRTTARLRLPRRSIFTRPYSSMPSLSHWVMETPSLAGAGWYGT